MTTMSDLELRKIHMSAACSQRLLDADFEGNCIKWGEFLAEVYYGEVIREKMVPVGLTALVVSREGRMELTKAGVSWVEEAERRWVEEEVTSEERRGALPGWAERAVTRPDRREIEGRAIVRELEKVRRLAAGYGRKWEAKVAERAARWVSEQCGGSDQCAVISDQNEERGAL